LGAHGRLYDYFSNGRAVKQSRVGGIVFTFPSQKAFSKVPIAE
jgi:hypothetical protein